MDYRRVETWAQDKVPGCICSEQDARAFSKAALRALLGGIGSKYPSSETVDWRPRTSNMGTASFLGHGITAQFRPVMSFLGVVTKINIVFGMTIDNVHRSYTVVVDNGQKWRVVYASLANVTCTPDQSLRELRPYD